MHDYSDFSLLLGHKESFEWEGYFKIPDALALPLTGVAFSMHLRRQITAPIVLSLTSPTDIVVASVNEEDRTVRLRFYKPREFTNLLYGNYYVVVAAQRNAQFVAMGRGKLEIETSLNR